jgi:hypothetical protein
MDAHTPRHEEHLSELERRLSGWRPGAQGLDADAMLFAAGLAAGRRGPSRVLWPALCGVLATLAAGLGAWGLSERAERQILASRLHDRAPAPSPSPRTETAIAQSTYEPSPGNVLSLRRQLEQDRSSWLSLAPPASTQPPGPPPPQRSILSSGQRGGLFDQ